MLQFRLYIFFIYDIRLLLSIRKHVYKNIDFFPLLKEDFFLLIRHKKWFSSKRMALQVQWSFRLDCFKRATSRTPLLYRPRLLL